MVVLLQVLLICVFTAIMVYFLLIVVVVVYLCILCSESKWSIYVRRLGFGSHVHMLCKYIMHNDFSSLMQKFICNCLRYR